MIPFFSRLLTALGLGRQHTAETSAPQRAPKVTPPEHVSDGSASLLEIAAPDLSGLSKQARAAATFIWQQLERGLLELPSLPDVALQINRKVGDPDTSVEDVVRLIQADPATASKLVQVANSPLYLGFDSVTTTTQAVTRMGLRTTRDVVVSISLRNLFTSDQPALRQAMRDLWEHSTLVAAVAVVLTRRHGNIHPDQAMMAGLIHDVGAMAVLHAYAQTPLEKRFPAAELSAVIEALKAPLGAGLIRSWGLGEALARVAYAETFTETESGPLSATDLMRIAHMHAFAGTPDMARIPSVTKIRALAKLNVDPDDPDQVIKELRDAKADIASIRGLLAR